MRLAYADPPYPGMAGLYPENQEVDHETLIEDLCGYDGWALSTDERSLAGVLALCPPGVRILAWCRSNAPFFSPNPAASWEPVICKPARIRPITVRSYYVSGVPLGKSQRDGLTGQKPVGFCEWVLRCLGAAPADELVDFFPGTGSMTKAWQSFRDQLPLFQPSVRTPHWKKTANLLRRSHDELPGMPPGKPHDERKVKVDRGKGRRAA